MITLTPKIDPLFGDRYYEDVKTIQYRRVVGALAWPAILPPPADETHGAVIVLGERRHEDHAAQTHRIDILAEIQASDTPTLLDEVIRLQELCCCTAWVADTTSKADFHEMKRHDDRQRAERRPRIRVGLALHYDDPVRLHALLRARTGDTKTLFFGSGSIAAQSLQRAPLGLKYEDLRDGYQPYLALLYALGQIDLRDYRTNRQRQQHNGPATVAGY